ETPFVIVAHSMGGLVARAFLEHQPHPFGPKGSLLVHSLITLATPHHGTPLANRVLRNRLAERNLGRPVPLLNLFDRFFWTWNSSPHLAHNATEPNRSDLLWDDYDGLFADLREDLRAGSLEANHSLAALRVPTGTRLVLYGGYLQFASDPEPAGPAQQLLRAAGRLLESQLNKPWNDGFVPLDSALFLGYPGTAERRVFAGHDHSDMMGSRPELQSDLLNALVADIAVAVPEPRMANGHRLH
ncbi:MAG: lysophospholipase, partial [bacterium]|nr:lysophospholipase [bacterium]